MKTEIKKHIESRLKELAKERIMYLVQKVQPGGFKSRATGPSDCHVFPDDWKTYEESCLDISELCNWCRLYFGESMRPLMVLPPIKLAEAEKLVTIEEAEKRLKEANPLVKVEPCDLVKYNLDESTDDKFTELAKASVKTEYTDDTNHGGALKLKLSDDDIQSALNPFKCDEDLLRACERVTWSQLNIDKPLVNNQRLQALGMIDLEVGDTMLSKNPADYDYLLKDGNVVCLLPVDDRKAETPLKGIPWRDLDVAQAAVARTLVTKALRVNPTIRDLAMHNYMVEDGKVVGLEFNPAGSMEGMLP